MVSVWLHHILTLWKEVELGEKEGGGLPVVDIDILDIFFFDN